MLACQRETGITHDPFAVKVMKCGSIVGHLPKKISSTCSAFLRHRPGVIVCRITDPYKRYSKDLEQGGLEIPCFKLNRNFQERFVSFYCLARRVATSEANLMAFRMIAGN